MKWKIFALTAIVCILPVIFGLAVWDLLPDKVAVHFDVNNNPDGFASKGFAVFGLPLFMVLLQFVCCLSTDINAARYNNPKNFEAVVKWIVPCITVIFYVATLGYSLNTSVDMRRIASLVVGAIFIVMGSYLPKFDYIKNCKSEPQKAKKINRIAGRGYLIIGLAFVASIFLPAKATLACLVLLIVYTLIGVIYGIRISQK